MADTTLEDRFVRGCEIAEAAAALALEYFSDRSRFTVKMKGFQDFLTEADGAVEEYVRSRLAAACPGDGVLGEEGGGVAAENLWIVDPIDGTSNFARGEPHWCISLGFMRGGVPELGFIVAPTLRETFSARRGHGAWLNGRPIHVSTTSDLRVAAIEIGWSARRPADDYINLVRSVMGAGGQAKRSASGALGMAWAACGRTDGYLETHINSWDVAAGLVIAREAGATVNDFFAGSGLIEGNPILAATPALARPLSDMMGLDPASLISSR